MTSVRHRIACLAGLGPLVLLAGVLYVHQIGNADFWMHLKAGEWMWAHRALPQTDPFSYTASAAPWTNFEWLYQILLYAAYRAGGLPATILLHALAAGATLVFLFRASPAIGVLPRALAALAPVFSLQAYAWIRPQVFSMLLLSVYVWRLGGDRPLTPAAAGGILLLQALWVNLHGGYALGLLVLGLHALDHVVRSRRLGVPASRLSLLLPLLGLCTVPLNPYGFGIVAHGVKELASRYARGVLSEWMSPFALLPERDAVIYFMLLTVVAITWSLRRGSSPSLFWSALVVALALLAARSYRFVYFFGLAAIPLVADHLAHIPWPAPSWRLILLRRIAGLAIVILPLAGSALAITGRLYAAANRITRPGLGVNADRLPVEAAAFLRTHAIQGPLLNAYEDGGYLIGALPDGPRVFVDGRNVLYGDGFLFDHERLRREPDHFRELDERHGFQCVLLPFCQGGHQGLVSLLLADPGWMLVHADSYAVVFVRRAGPNADRAPELRPAEEKPPARFLFPAPGRLVGRSFWRSLLVEPLPGELLSTIGRICFYQVSGNPAMEAYWMARFLEAAPAYAYDRAGMLEDYRGRYARLPAWQREPR